MTVSPTATGTRVIRAREPSTAPGARTRTARSAPTMPRNTTESCMTRCSTGAVTGPAGGGWASANACDGDLIRAAATNPAAPKATDNAAINPNAARACLPGLTARAACSLLVITSPITRTSRIGLG
ncbi:hypothetical protein [Alloactinosynnema sp. L-07]|uniref:hypothetical protein n=1 Tax=Alloactinosynnema sp. L-07 TaxID=1653480 RepID=UPI0012FB1DF0|nr:hypothetical protein [Alloactinosynnema sp. L-07]